MKIDFGEHLVSAEDTPDMDRWMHHLHKNVSMEERKELFHEAHRDGQAHFSPKLGVHLVLRREDGGTYTLEKGR
jgi:hypothetical protein